MSPEPEPRLWSDEEVSELLRLMQANTPQKAIATALDRTHSAVRAKLRTLRKQGSSVPVKKKFAGGRPISLFTPSKDRPELHIRAALTAGGYSWLKEASAKRFYVLESAPPTGRPFWRAA